MFRLAQKLTPILSRLASPKLATVACLPLRTNRAIKSAAAPAFGTPSRSYLSHANRGYCSISSPWLSNLPKKNVLSAPFLGLAIRSTLFGNANSLLEMYDKLQVRGFATAKVNFSFKLIDFAISGNFW